jgi:hypothetical protein
MDLKKIKKHFVDFLGKFKIEEMQMVMEFLDLTIDEYKKNPWKLISISNYFNHIEIQLLNILITQIF